MSINKRALHFAHSEGHTDLCYTDDGRQIITCGSDGDIRIWEGIEDTDPESYCVGEGAFSVVQKGEDIYVCRDDGRVSILKYPEGQRNGTLTRFTAPATHITVSKISSMIACVAADFSVKVFRSLQDVHSTDFSDLKGPALGVAISPNENLLAVSCGDGKVYIWNLLEKKLIKTIECVPRVNCFTSAKVLCRVSFDPKGKYFAYPHNNEIIITNTDNYDKIFSLNATQVQAAFSIVQFSPCGNFIAASSTNGDICIWQCQPESIAVVTPHEQKYNVCALAWNPEVTGEISYCDNTGQIGSLEYIPKVDDSIQLEIDTNNLDINIEPPDDDDDDDDNVISLEKIKNDTLGLGDFRSTSAAGGSSGSPSRAQSPERPRSPPCTLQPPFQPSSTPAHLTQRFMVFNEIGVIRLHNDDDDTSSIDIQFHDASFYKNLFMKNNLNHSMASLSSSVLALACETPSKLVCIPLKVGTKEWTTELTDLEEILCIAASSSLVALASNVRMLRVFSVFGTQRAVLSVPGPVVSISANKNYVFVIYHACTAHSKDQNLAGMLVHINGSIITNKIMPIPITPQSTLSWVGFSDTGSLATYDSAGILRICRLNSGAWIPVCDTTIHAKGASDSYFLISIKETSQNIQVVHCKGAIYPATTPLPILIELPMQIPMCEIETDKAQMEDKLFRWSFFETDQPDKAFKEAAIKLFALACKNDLDDRALEILESLNNPQLVNFALKYANKLNKNRLVDKLTNLLQKLQGITESNDEKLSNTSIRPSMHRLNKSRIEPSQNSEFQSQQLTCSSDIFSNSTIIEDSQSQNETMNMKPVKNPFIKTANNENKRNPLSLTNTTDVLEVVTIHNEPIKNIGKETSQNKSIEKESFQNWYQKQKPGLEKENPELSAGDLVKIALKLFRKQAEKRKASDDVENNSQKAKQAKLSAFAFSKNN